jgi:hypothetical protein
MYGRRLLVPATGKGLGIAPRMSPQNPVGGDHKHQGGGQEDDQSGDIAEEIHNNPFNEDNALIVTGSAPRYTVKLTIA